MPRGHDGAEAFQTLQGKQVPQTGATPRPVPTALSDARSDARHQFVELGDQTVTQLLEVGALADRGTHSRTTQRPDSHQRVATSNRAERMNKAVMGVILFLAPFFVVPISYPAARARRAHAPVLLVSAGAGGGGAWLRWRRKISSAARA